MVQGHVYYSYGNYKIEPRDTNDVIDLSIQPPTVPNLKINEILYDTPGTDHGTFTEIMGEPGTSLDNVYLVGMNGSDGPSNYSRTYPIRQKIELQFHLLYRKQKK